MVANLVSEIKKIVMKMYLGVVLLTIGMMACTAYNPPTNEGTNTDGEEAGGGHGW